MNIRTEKAIKAWLALENEDRSIIIDDSRNPSIELRGESGNLVARFTIKSIVAKRYPRRKKAEKV